MHNRVELIGYLGADPEMKRLGSGDPVVNMRLATSETWKDKATGERKEATEWHSIVIYNEHICRVAEQYVKKGSLVRIEGKLKTRKFTDREGKDQYRTEVVLDRFGGGLTLFPNGGGNRQAHGPESYGTQRTRDDAREGSGDRRPAPTGGERGGYALDDDIPF